MNRTVTARLKSCSSRSCVNSKSFAVLDKDLAGQGSQRARGQRVLDETLGLRRATRIHLHAFDAQFQSALDVAEFNDFDSGGQGGGAARANLRVRYDLHDG